MAFASGASGTDRWFWSLCEQEEPGVPGEADRVDREQMGAQGLEARVTGRGRRAGGTDS